MDDSRQRAREALNRVLDIQGDRGGGEWFAHTDTPWIIARVIGDAIEAYFDERMRGEPRELAIDVAIVQERDALRARVAELEAVVRAADKLAADVRLYGGLHQTIDEALAADAFRGCNACDEEINEHDFHDHRADCALIAYDIARAKVEAPHV